MSARDQQYWDNVADDWSVPPQNLWRRHSDAVHRRLIEKLVPPRVERLLKTDAFDEAVGEGVLPLLEQRGSLVVEVDISAEMLGMARTRYPGLVPAAADTRRLPFANASFDQVVSLSTLDHFPDPTDIRRSLCELRRVMRPNGQLVITLDNQGNPVVALRNALPFAWLHRIGLVPYYVGPSCSPRVFRRLLAETGFVIRQETATVHVPRVLAVALAALVDRFGGDRSRRWFLHLAMAWERLAALPTRMLTGHFMAIRAEIAASPASTEKGISR